MSERLKKIFLKDYGMKKRERMFYVWINKCGKLIPNKRR